MTTATATETKTFALGDRVYYSSPDYPGHITAIARGEATVQTEDGRTVTAPVDKLTLLPKPVEPAPQREWQVGDRVRGEHPKTHLPCTGIFHKQGYKYMTLQSPGGTTPILAETAELLIPADEVIERPCPFTEGDLLDYQGQRWEAGKIQKTPLLTWRVVLIEPDPGAGWRPEYLEWPCDEDCPAAAVAPEPLTTAPAIAAAHTPEFLSPNLAKRLLEFSQGLDWQQNQFRIYGKQTPLPRLEIMFGDPGCTYRYGNVTLSPVPWPPELQALREQVEAATGHSYQVVIGNLYRSGADHIGWHSDDSPEMGESPAIASISLGATRRFNVRDESTREVDTYELESGDLVFMPPGFQSTHKHRIAKTTKEVGLRINWTFRPHVGGAIPAEIVTADPGDRLAELEADITEGLGLIEQGKAKIWAAVAAVRSEELWQVAGHPSFEVYCEARWGWKKANAHENALAGEVLTGLLESGVPVEVLPTSTSAMSQLAKADPGDRPAVLQKAADLNGGKVTEAAVREALKPELAAGDYVSPKWETQRDEIGVVERVIKTRTAHAMHNLEIKWLTHRGSSFAHSDGMIKRSPDDPLVIKAVKRREAENKALDDSLPAEDLTAAEAATLGLIVCKPDTSPEAIALGLETGYLRPTTEQPTSASAAAHADTSPGENTLSGAETPAPFDEALKDHLEPGRFVRVANHPGVWYFAQLSPDGHNAMVWSRNGHHLAPLSDLSLNQFCDPASLNRVALDWLSELVSVLGPEQVQVLLGEVVS